MLTPTGDRLIVKLINGEEEQRKTGLIIPDFGRKKRVEAVVLAMGPGKSLPGRIEPITDIAVGDTILISKDSGADFGRGEDTLRIIAYDQVLGVRNDGVVNV